MAPAWSRDGRSIYYSQGRVSFWKIAWNGGTPVLVAKTGARMDPRVSDDGKHLYYMGEVTQGLKTHRVSWLANLPGKPDVKRHGLAVSPDGSAVLYTSVDTEIGDIMLLEGIR